jgi:hypothetical protein
MEPLILNNGDEARTPVRVALLRRWLTWRGLGIFLLLLFSVLWAVVDKLLKKKTQRVFGSRLSWYSAQLGSLFYAAMLGLILLAMAVCACAGLCTERT